ncbi:MAG: SRPBCC family protein [Candidatus Hodarchaeales archaeon]
MSKNLTVEKDINIKADISSVWNALTNPAVTKQYFLNCEAISDWNTGDPIIFKMNSDGKEVIPVKGLITRIKKGTFLEYTCFAPEFENDVSRHTHVTYQLSTTKNGTTIPRRIGMEF